MYQCTGTGLITGDVIDADSGDGIHLAIVSNSKGGKALSINGGYMIVAPSAISTVTANATGYTHEDIPNVTVHGGNVTWVDFTMHSE